MLIGNKIKLRAAEPSDLDVIYSWENDPENWLVSNTIAPFSRYQILQFIENANDIYSSNQLRFLISNHKDELAGCIDFYDFDPKNKRVGIGVLVDKAHRGHGYAQEALTLAADYAFKMLEVKGIHAEILVSNETSIKLFEKAGFIKNGVKKEWLWDGEAFVDQLFYQLNR